MIDAETHKLHQPTFRIQIDRVHYEVHSAEMTGLEVREVPKPPIPRDRDLYEVRPGESDRLIEDSTVVHIRDGLRFFTVPHHINPGNVVVGTVSLATS